MEPVLDETSLVPCGTWAPGARILALSSVLASLDRLGVPRVLRSVADAADRDISQGRGFRSWCFDVGTNRDAGRLVASRLSRQPFVDGPCGLLAVAEGARVLETRVDGELVYGLGLGALEERIVAALASGARPEGASVKVKILDVTADEFVESSVPVFAYVHGTEIDREPTSVQVLVDDSLRDGKLLLERFAEVFPQLRLGSLAADAIGRLAGSEPVYRQLIRHLRALNAAASTWIAGTAFTPQGITFSPESSATLESNRFGPIRDFSTPEGFAHERWSLHTKLTGGAGARLYYRPVSTAETRVVLIGYFGPHLPCVRFPT
jgi:hypothetical protein